MPVLCSPLFFCFRAAVRVHPEVRTPGEERGGAPGPTDRLPQTSASPTTTAPTASAAPSRASAWNARSTSTVRKKKGAWQDTAWATWRALPGPSPATRRAWPWGATTWAPGTWLRSRATIRLIAPKTRVRTAQAACTRPTTTRARTETPAPRMSACRTRGAPLSRTRSAAPADSPTLRLRPSPSRPRCLATRCPTRTLSSTTWGSAPW